MQQTDRSKETVTKIKWKKKKIKGPRIRKKGKLLINDNDRGSDDKR